MSWTDLNWSFGNILTSSDMNSMQDNYTAMMQGSTGSPRLDAKSLTKGLTYDKTVVDTSSGDLFYFEKGLYNIKVESGSGANNGYLELKDKADVWIHFSDVNGGTAKLVLNNYVYEDSVLRFRNVGPDKMLLTYLRFD